ncbi:hypothetical protein CCUS01_09929 [Colletotrichum cuscutae]|uniref:Uncharacterized protein n=1 Tax=Colletotrichum cuscutae TaxID=1209917 RepID=A0AAI9XN61_9PEZI|nr:hypothetical protein CCUS01_09929 [Colletotrichum cuscutae]
MTSKINRHQPRETSTEIALIQLPPQTQSYRARTGTYGLTQASRRRRCETTSTTYSRSPKLKPDKQHPFQDNLTIQQRPQKPRVGSQYHSDHVRGLC